MKLACGEHAKKLCSKDDCDDCFKRSFASHEKSLYWAKTNAKSPRNIFKSSHTRCDFDCLCGHSFSIMVYNITHGKQWCPYCRPGGKICGSPDCKSCVARSFATHEKSKYWSNKNIDKPHAVPLHSSQKFIFDCPCGHEISVIPNYINNWCPYCCEGSRMSFCNDLDCASCFNHSFASHEKSKYISDELNPRFVAKASGVRCNFICDKNPNHTFSAKLNNITTGHWCPFCVNKTESKLLDILIKSGFIVRFQPRFEWCINEITGKMLPFDFAIDEYEVLIELDGRQHFEQVQNWNSPEEQHTRDMKKMRDANNNEYTIIRILQEDVLYDKNNWYNQLMDAICYYEKPTQIFIGGVEQYKKMKGELT